MIAFRFGPCFLSALLNVGKKQGSRNNPEAFNILIAMTVSRKVENVRD